MTVPAASSIDIDQLSGMKRKQIQSLCKKHGIKANAKTEDLVEQLTEYVKNGGSSLEAVEVEDSDQGDRGEEEHEHEHEHEHEDGDSGENETKDENNKDEEECGDGNSGNMNESKDGTNSQNNTLNSSAVELGDENAQTQAGNDPVSVEEPVQMSDETPADITDTGSSLTATEQIAAEMQARVAALAAEERKEIVGRYNAEKGTGPATPSRSKELLSPKSVSFDRVHSNIFDKDDSIASHWAAKKVPGAATPKGKRLSSDDLAQNSSKRARVEPLFTSQIPMPTEQSPIEDSLDSISKITADNGDSMTAKPGSEQKACENGGGDAEECPVDVPKVSDVTSKPSSDMLLPVEQPSLAGGVDPKTASEEQANEPASTLDPETTKSKNISAIPKPPSSSSSSSSLAAANKIPGYVSNKIPATGAKPANSVVAAGQKAGYRNVESKIKSYIHANLPSPKVKPVKRTVIDPKMKPKPEAASKKATASAKPTHVVEKKAVSGAGGEKALPNYMKPTRAAESRAHKPATATASVRGNSENKGGKDRVKPYSRPAKPATTSSETAEKPAALKEPTKENASLNDTPATTN
ncbi:hypothetical protein H4R99_006080 [Coemansia sp. RSA 1722]|nr:hypothetical protein LPJ57_000389 [Coemansia sp. RSA 486]KAJ2228484.1 hypothetical protein IWW45_006587 [Coemansia sp. RSA 485]KAJ2593468.1 hypothetical protein H4R99_006080 [Coemansia sp. RSA 1722]KAJ2640302.1 hypothetical protein GGF40_000201 [Coemansia sp. RSA 1286]